MKTIGLVGGMSWHSTATYYRILNEQVAARRGGHASARISLQSLDFAEIRDCQIRGDWIRSGELIADAARRCEAGGADLVALCTNLMHTNFGAFEDAVTVPAVHIADAVAAVAQANGWRTVSLIGTRGVMEGPFYTERLAGHGIDVIVPDETGRELLDRVIFDELTQGVIREESRAAYLNVICDQRARGAEAVVLACTEIGLLVRPGDAPLPMIDTVEAHAQLLVELALEEASVS
ncbi:aspartate/glutamate racemase family protein [Aeromicrobium wangtongii]|uniref:Amino acid racemase n=1 Tax=Aeromicrobium wangtongii TaxID=2969247 RepID=A0ABY5M7M2_9ACTN|nr:amino acid racemase [Aeromicrobium wangtongii]MCD9198649.1 amino acid racemase [Aeromicrobium wangtongii]UUP12673.1 amino acid racemase [Aeromicrobium wangtongii]